MKLYFSPGACSLASHIALREAGVPFELVRASTKTHQLDDGRSYYDINPKGYVPLLELDDGQRLTENPAVLQYIADQAPDKQLAPAAGSLARYRLQEWLGFIGTEIHKQFGPLFQAGFADDVKNAFRDKIRKRLEWTDGQLAGKPYLMGDRYSVPDGYLYVVLTWTAPMGIDLAPYQHLQAFKQRMEERPAVKAALQAEQAAKG
jgi:glutathione S-transferase